MVVQRDSISKARTLLVNSTQSEQPLEPVTVEVQEGGVYQVTIIAIREGVGVVGSGVEYSTQVAMNEGQGWLFMTIFSNNYKLYFRHTKHKCSNNR